jgi:hypothetical protein
MEVDQKQVLVVCSYPQGNDFGSELNNNLKLIFGTNTNYVFCDGREFNLENHFPFCPVSDDKYDFIWFAGCNLIQSIFKGRKEMISLEKIRSILKPNGYVLFTESKKYVDTYKTFDNTLTVTLEILDQHSRGKYFYDRVNTDIIFKYFTENFVQKQINNHIVYQIKTVGGNYLKKSKNNRMKKKKKYSAKLYLQK